MTEYQAAILLAQMKRLEEQTQRRWDNATYLTSKIQGIPGITPHRLNDGVTRAAYHLYPFRYNPQAVQRRAAREVHGRVAGARGSRARAAIGRLNRQPFFENTLSSRNFQRMYSKEQLDHCRQQIECPGQRPPLPRGGLAQPESPAGKQGRHGRHR